MTRVAFLAAAAYALSAGLTINHAAGIWGPAIALSLVLYGAALIALVATFTIRDPFSRGAQAFLAGLVLATLVGSVAYGISVANASYGTDSIAVAHVGGELLLEGENPYSVVGEPLGPIIDRFGLPETFVTRTTSGDPIERLSPYPAGHLLAFTGALALGVDDLRWATLTFEVAALALIWWALSPQARLLVPLVLLIEPNLSVYFTSGGVTDWVWVLPLVVTAMMLHRERWGYAGLALGIACAIKQQPWFVVPFVLLWAYMRIQERGDEASVRHDFGALIVGVVTGFAVPNLPFLIWAPDAWFRGTFSAILDHLVPDGEGISLLASRGFLPWPQAVFSIAMVVALVIALYLYWRRFQRLRNLLWVLPPIVLLFSHRSFHNYFVFWIPIAALWLDLEAGPPREPTLPPVDSSFGVQSWRHRKLTLFAIGAVVMVSAGIGVFLGSRNVIAVGSVQAEVNGGMVTHLDVELVNKGAESVRPVFEVYWGRYPVPWEPLEPTEIGPGQSTVVRIVPTSRGVIPPLTINDDGAMQPKPFRVRVNDRGHSSYTSSALVSLDEVADPVINSAFRYWGPNGGRIDESPFGWTSVELAPSGASVNTRTLGSGQGVYMSVAHMVATTEGWGEAAITQEVAAVATCYRLDIATSNGYSANEEGRPLAATGLQVIQGASAVWFVLSEVMEIRVTDMPEGTRIVEIPATVGERELIEFDLTVTGLRSAISPGERGTIKLFNALHESQPGPQELRVAAISECEGRSAADA